MRRILPSTLGLVSLTTALVAQGPPTPPLESTGTAAISGVVTDAVTGRPIAGANVFLTGMVRTANGRPIEGSILQLPRMLTDAHGRFVFVNLPATHEYSLFASRAGYDAGEYEGPATAADRSRSADGVPIRVKDGEWMRNANVRMWRFSSITGRVVDERGEAVVGVAVRLFSRQLIAGHERLIPGPVASTDDRGVYRLVYLEPGRYYMAVLSVQATVPVSIADGPRQLPLGGLIARGRSAPPVARAEAQGSSVDVDGRHRLMLTNFATPPPPGADRPRAYPPVFYPNASTIEAAQSIEFEAGTSRADIDFQLAPVSAVRISGHVTGAVQDVANMILRLMPQGGEHLGSGSEVATTMVEADRRFVFLNVPAGNYTLLASPAVTEMNSGGSSPQGTLPMPAGAGPMRGYSTVYSWGGGFSAMWWRFTNGASGWGRAPIAVGNSDIDGVDLPLQPAGVVRGRLVFDDPRKADPILRFTVMLEPVNADPLLGLPNAVTAAGDTTYAFTIGGVQSGRYLVRISSFRGWRVKSVTVRGVDVTDTGIEGAPGREDDDVVVTITDTGAELSGVVHDSTGRPATGAVILFPADPKLWVDYGLTPDRLQSITAGRDGRFKLMAHRDGEYYVIAVPRAQADGWSDRKFLTAAAARATRVSLKSGAVIEQNLQLSEVVVK
jgi:hypothetical protein